MAPILAVTFVTDINKLLYQYILYKLFLYNINIETAVISVYNMQNIVPCNIHIPWIWSNFVVL